MATTEQAGTEQCRALTADGGRCSRPAQEDGFCYQHDESDPTVDEQDEESNGGNGESSADDTDEQSTEGGEESNESDQEAADEQDDQEQSETEADADADSASSDEGTPPAETDVDEGDRTVTEEDLGESGSTILGVRRTVEGTATGLIGQPLDSITEVTATEDGWRAIVEVVERSSVPDTQDILGQYEIELSDEIQVRGYRRIDRYRRSDTDK